MLSWAAIESKVNAVLLAKFGVPVTFTPQDGDGGWLTPQTITGIESLPPNFGPEPAVLWLRVDLSAITPAPTHGDQITYGGNNYVVQDLKADTTGTGVLLKLRIM
jgi:hypothetical protein